MMKTEASPLFLFATSSGATEVLGSTIEYVLLGLEALERTPV